MISLPSQSGLIAAAFIIAALAVIIAIGLNPARWQVYPAVVGLGLIGMWLLPSAQWGVWSVIVGGILLVLSGILLVLLPIKQVPAPRGAYAVGTSETRLERRGEAGARQLFVKLWYPADLSEKARESLWQDMRQMGDIPAGMRMALAYLGAAKTHARSGAKVAKLAKPLPVLIYNHAFLSWASENTLLIEELASHGYIIASVRHQDQVAEQAQLDSDLGEDLRAAQAEIQSQIMAADTREERSRLTAELVAQSTVSNEITARRAADSAFVAGRLSALLQDELGLAVEAPWQYVAIGYSLGGAVATRLCAADESCLATVNLDGGLYGVDVAGMREVPYLMVYSGDNLGGNDAAKTHLGATYHELVFEEFNHSDLQDTPYFIPMMRKNNGRQDAAFLESKNRLADDILRFLERV